MLCNFYVEIWKLGHHASWTLSEHLNNIQRFLERNCFQDNWPFATLLFRPIHQYELPRSSSERIQNHLDLETNFTVISVAWTVSFFLVNNNKPSRWLPVLLLDYLIQFFRHSNELKEANLEFPRKTTNLESKKLHNRKVSRSENKKLRKLFYFT